MIETAIRNRLTDSYIIPRKRLQIVNVPFMRTRSSRYRAVGPKLFHTFASVKLMQNRAPAFAREMSIKLQNDGNEMATEMNTGDYRSYFQRLISLYIPIL